MFDFATPPREFLPLLRWEWESFAAADAGVLRQTLQTIEQAGFGGIVLHLPHGWSTPASPLMQALAHECDVLDLKLWLQVYAAAAGSEHHAQFLSFHLEDVSRNEALHWQPPILASSQIVCATAAPLDIVTGKLDFARAVDLTASLQNDSIALPPLPGAARVFIFSIEHDSTLDWMSQAAARDFIQQADRWLAPLLTDPHRSTPGLIIETGETAARASGQPRLPWSPQLPQAFLQLHGYDLVPRLPSLLADTGAEATRVRQDFWRSIATLSQQNSWQYVNQWAQAHHISIVPALERWEFAPRLQELIQCGDTSALAGQSTHVEVSRATEQGLSLRVAAGVAALEPNKATGAEIGRDFGLEATLADKLARFHRLLHEGARNITIASPPVPGVVEPGEIQQPYWARWRHAANYIARCAWALAQGKPGARVGVLLPTRSEWTHHHPRGHRLTRWVGEDLDMVMSLLNQLHYDFVLVPEPDLCNARCEGPLLVGETQHRIELLIVPGATALSWAAWHKVEEYVESGGKVACFGLLPRWSERGRDEEFQARIDKTTMVNVGELYDVYAVMEGDGEMPPTIGYPVYREHRSGGRMCAYQPRLNDDADDARLRVRQILRESLPPDFETQSPEILYTRRILEDGDLYFIVNTGQQTQHINARLRGQPGGVPHVLDAWTGTVQPLPVWTPYDAEEGGGAGLELDLAPQEARLIWMRVAPEYAGMPTPIEHASFFVEAFDGDMARGYARESDVPRLAVREQGRLRWHSGEAVNVPPYLLLPDEWSAVCPQHPEIGPLLLAAGSWHEQGLPEYSGVVQYSQRVAIPEAWKNCRIFLELSRVRDAAEVIVNGTICGVCVAAPYSVEVTAAIVPDTDAEIALQIWNTAQARFADTTGELMPSGLLGPARLVAYPVVEIAVAPHQQ